MAERVLIAELGVPGSRLAGTAPGPSRVQPQPWHPSQRRPAEPRVS